MTTHRTSKVYCAICGTPRMVMELTSHISFGGGTQYFDLSNNFTFTWAQIQYCISCGYSASKIAKHPKHPEVMKSKEYQAVLMHRWINVYCKAYLCHALFLRSESEFAKAAWSTFRAATLCDGSYWQGALDYRLKAVELIVLAHANRQKLNRASGEDFVWKADLLRQCGEFERAKDAINAGFACNPAEVVQELLNAELRLVDSGDTERRSVHEAGV